MKLLFDQNISYRIARKLSDCYPDCKQVRELGLANAEDVDIWDYARKNLIQITEFCSLPEMKHIACFEIE